MRQIEYVLIVAILMTSCAPVMRVSVKKQKEYPPLEQDAHVVIYKKPQQIPIEYEKLGKINIFCSNQLVKKNDTTRCKSTSIFHAAESKAKEIGGNALLITLYKEPAFGTPHFQLSADILKVFDFSPPPRKVSYF
jgi:hypothetical protein